jgi:D-alanine-D-alanine ligase-like ATP-grasp enzyme
MGKPRRIPTPSPRESASLTARAFGVLSDCADVAGNRGRTVASWIDLLRSTGPGYAWRSMLRGQLNQPWLPNSVRNTAYRRIWTDAAAAVAAQIHPLSDAFLSIERDGVSVMIFQQLVGLDDPVALRLALDKPIVHRLLLQAGLPVASYLEFHYRDPEPALRFLAATSGPCVVKPASGTAGGEGITAGVETAEQFMRARLAASRQGSRLLIERQIDGPVHRLLLLDGELLDVVRNQPPRLVGDGRSTIERLIVAENARRATADGEAGLSLLHVRLDMIFALHRQGLRLSSVLPTGQEVAVQSVTNDNRIEDRETVTDQIDSEVVSSARAAVDAVGLRLAGVDIIAPNISQPLRVTGGVIAEVNGTPGLHHHYHVKDRSSATAVAVPVLDRALRERTRQLERLPLS